MVFTEEIQCKILYSAGILVSGIAMFGMMTIRCALVIERFGGLLMGRLRTLDEPFIGSL